MFNNQKEKFMKRVLIVCAVIAAICLCFINTTHSAVKVASAGCTAPIAPDLTLPAHLHPTCPECPPNTTTDKVCTAACEKTWQTDNEIAKSIALAEYDYFVDQFTANNLNCIAARDTCLIHHPQAECDVLCQECMSNNLSTLNTYITTIVLADYQASCAAADAALCACLSGCCVPVGGH